MLALVACAWYVVSIRQAQDTNRAQAIILSAPQLTIAQANRADSLLHSAAFLNPDRQVDVLRAEVAVARGNLAKSDRILFGVVRAEPMNLNAWFQLVSHPLNPRIFGEAGDAVSRLVREPKTP